MLVTSAVSLFASTLFLSTTSAAPTRTHCRCTIVTDVPPAAIFTPSAAHWSPAESSPSPIAADICSNLGPELENFQHTKPDLYESYLAQTEGHSQKADQQRPLTATVLVDFSSRSGLSRRNQGNEEPRPTTRPNQRIVCHSETDAFTAYQSSFVTLWALQIIIAIAILACIAEGIHLSVQWYKTSQSTSQRNRVLQSMGGMMRLPGSQKLWMALSTSRPGETVSEKDPHNCEATPILIVEAPNGERVVIAYEEDDDDEMYRPVM
ncbi:hypothetical protein FB567DRAFT_136228 [Paraphoma chrysanthemicola]|uniref:Uncharacterized protein n=1 Tax=Paraphoma chrysanthemicola TaxID=798071 RepID=A0A8K0QXM2_9PLEO|nr:hypothetical protein FB567DRAFT_136228 [Paraphoma chrysanthemicola]